MSENPIGQMPIFSSTVRALNIVVKCNGRYGVQTFVTAFGALACALQRVELAIVSLLIQLEINLVGTMTFAIDVAEIWLTFCTFQRHSGPLGNISWSYSSAATAAGSSITVAATGAAFNSEKPFRHISPFAPARCDRFGEPA